MKKILRSTLLFAVLVFAGCEDFVTGVEELDPTRPTDADLRQIFIATEVEFMGTMEGELARYAGMFSGYFTGIDRQHKGYQDYNMSATDFDTPWGNVYTFTLGQARITQQKAAALNNKITLGIAQVMEAHLIGTAASIWGDVPYREAVNVKEFPNPKYDPQAQVIDDVLLLLDEAIANLTTGAGGRDGDFLGTGTAQWIKIANSIKARYLLYKEDYAGSLAAANLGILAPADNMLAPHGPTLNQNQNSYYDFLVNKRAGDLAANGAFLPNLLNGVVGQRNNAKTGEAARAQRYYSGAGPAYSINTSSTGFFAVSASFPLFTSAENLLTRAECKVRTNDLAGALADLNTHRGHLRAAYPTGIYTDYVAADFQAGGMENADNIVEADALLREIREEKYVSLYGQIEAFNEMRRTNFGVGVQPNTGSQHAKRFIYSQVESISNINTPSPLPTIFTDTDLFD